MLKQLSILFAALLASALACAEAPVDGTVPVHYYEVEDLAVPFQITNQNSAAQQGIITDILTEALQDTPYVLVRKALPVNRLHVDIRKDTALWITYDAKVWNSLLDVGTFVSPSLFIVTHTFLTCHARAPQFDDESLRNNRVAVLNYFQYPELAARQDPLQLIMVPVNNYEQGINLVRLGRVDGFVEMDIRLRYNLRQIKSDSGCLKYLDFSDVIQPYDIYLAVSKTADPLFVQLLSDRITEMRNNGQIEKIIESYVATH